MTVFTVIYLYVEMGISIMTRLKEGRYIYRKLPQMTMSIDRKKINMPDGLLHSKNRSNCLNRSVAEGAFRFTQRFRTRVLKTGRDEPCSGVSSFFSTRVLHAHVDPISFHYRLVSQSLSGSLIVQVKRQMIIRFSPLYSSSPTF